MRISEDRYCRDQLRLHIALRFIQLEARTHTIRAWTGLTDDRIRKLYRFYASGLPGSRPTRHRGKSPQQSAFFTRSAQVREQAALLASLLCLLGVVPAARGSESARALPSLKRAEALCQAYELYRELLPDPAISFEHAMFLLQLLAAGEELSLSGCRDCGALLVADRWSLRAPRCAQCAADPALVAAAPAAVPAALARPALPDAATAA